MTTDTFYRGLVLLACILFLAPAAGADYTGGSLAVASSGSVTGNVLIEHGSSRYSGDLSPGGTYSVTFPVDVPASATIRIAQVYLFWTWSHDGTEGVTPTLKATVGGTTLAPARSYADRKGSGTYDYPSGTTVYNAAAKTRPGSPLTLTVTNAASGAGVAFSGAVLLLAYDGGSAETRYWVAEGADMLYATGPVTADAATARIAFTGVPALSSGATADLLSVVPGGNKGTNTLTVNSRAFPGLFAGKPYADLAIATTAVGPYLRAGSNSVTIRDEGDYIVPGLFVLRVASVAPASPTATATTERTTTTTHETQTTTMTATTTQIIPATTATAVGGTGTTFTPGITILPSVTATAAPSENVTPNATITFTSGPVSITPADDAQATVNTTTVASVTAITAPIAAETSIAATEPATGTTTDPTAEPTTRATTEATTETTTPAGTATAAVTAEPEIMGGRGGTGETPPPSVTDSNASVFHSDGGQPPGTALAGAGEILPFPLPSSSDALLGLGVAVFWLCVGGGIIVASALVGAGLVSRIGGPGRTGRSETARIGEGSAPAARPGRHGDDR